MDEQTAIEVKNLAKQFVLPHQRKSTLKSFFINPFKRFDNESQKAFKDISFDVKKGEFFGIVGRNGSGKSTLLKCLAGVYKPEHGTIEIDGTLVPFIELGVGFNPQLSGRDNVFLNGSLLGFTRKEMQEMYKEIVDFSELENFMDQKLKNYSSGMQVRLAFSIAIRAKGDILLLDEVLAVGDSAFQQKCFDYFDTIKGQNKTIVLVTHSMGIVEKYCDRAMFIEDGKVKHIGESQDVARLYEEMFLEEETLRRAEERKLNREKARPLNKKIDETVRIKEVKIFQHKKQTNRLKARDDFEVRIDFVSRENLENVNVQINIKNRRGTVVVAADTEDSLGLFGVKENIKKTVVFKIENDLTNDIYLFNVSFVDTTNGKIRGLTQRTAGYEFNVKGVKKYTDAITHPDISARIE